MPSWALFLATMAPAGPMVQQTMAWGLAFLILVSWGVMSVSLGPKDSLATKVMPNSGASFSSHTAPSLPKGSDAVRRATLVSFFSFR